MIGLSMSWGTYKHISVFIQKLRKINAIYAVTHYNYYKFANLVKNGLILMHLSVLFVSNAKNVEIIANSTWNAIYSYLVKDLRAKMLIRVKAVFCFDGWENLENCRRKTYTNGRSQTAPISFKSAQAHC